VRPVGGASFGRSVAVDGKGNTFVSLAYEGNGLDLGGGALVGDAGVAVAKYAPDGKHLWSRGFPTLLGTRPTVSAMTVDVAGNVYIAGEHREPSLDLGGEPVPAGIFLAKYAPDGTHLWSRSTKLPGVKLLPPSALAVDERRGHLVAAVNFLDPGQPLGAALIGRALVGDGQVFSLKPVATWGRLSVTGLALDWSGNLAVVGFFEGEVDLGGGPLRTVLPRSPFIARFNPEVRHLWSRGLEGAEGAALGVAVASSRILVVGEYSGSFTFRGKRQPAEGRDGFIAAYATSGGELWVRHFAESARAVGVDADDRMVVVGQYRPGDCAGGSKLPSRAGGTPDNHLFVAKLYRGSGGHEWSRGVFSDGVLRAGSLTSSRSGEAVLVSDLEGTVNLGTGPVSGAPGSAVLLRLSR
ncbi:MAG TPA: hypothetical protein VF794_33660, partial [Archangium sp.]|uniref:hypothetical protein n=1 Tax=Archangium sp. TaxID=1872627 RepID=UPI002ED7BC77